jgi:glycosyltransferase involved in cell wall biosynthesis
MRVSVIIPTRDRPRDLANLLLTILSQDYPIFEAIVIDDSPRCTAESTVKILASKFAAKGCGLRYIEADGTGLTVAKNMGVRISKGDIILFLDDDMLLEQSAIRELANFLRDNPEALGVQPRILLTTRDMNQNGLSASFENALCKAFMLGYKAEDRLVVRRSGMSIFPSSLSRSINAQRLAGSACWRHEIFERQLFDVNLKRWAFMEDLDFSYRVFKKNPKSLFAIPNAAIVHKTSQKGRMEIKPAINMVVIYWFYVFFKDIFEDSMLNLIAFLWALTGNLLVTLAGSAVKRKGRKEWWDVIYLFGAYRKAFENLRKILMEQIAFFDKDFSR